MILSFGDLRDFRQRAALVDGAFDPLHHGHVQYIRAARNWLDSHGYADGVLLCNVAPDRYVRTKHEPLLCAAERAAMVTQLKGVYGAYTGETRTADVLRELQPTHYLKGKGWEGRLPLEQITLCEAQGTRIVFLDDHVASSTDLLRSYQQRTDRQALVDLERFIQEQPAQQPWVPVTDYSLEARREAEGPHAQLIQEVLQPVGGWNGRPESVLDYGAGHGHLVTMLRELGVEAVGYEPLYKTTNPHVHDYRQQVDVVICREVFEHLPLGEWRLLVWWLVECSKRLIYLTTRFHPNPLHLLSVTSNGNRDIDPTEITFANKDLLRTLFLLHDCKHRPDLEAKMDWRGLGRCLVYEV